MAKSLLIPNLDNIPRSDREESKDAEVEHLVHPEELEYEDGS